MLLTTGRAQRGWRGPARNALSIVTVAALGTAGLLMAMACSGGAGVDRDEYVEANRALFDQVPRFPGSTVVDEVSTPYRMFESAPPVGYGTRFVLALPAAVAPRDVVAFFEAELNPEWKLVDRLDGPVLNYRRDAATLSINVGELAC